MVKFLLLLFLLMFVIYVLKSKTYIFYNISCERKHIPYETVFTHSVDRVMGYFNPSLIRNKDNGYTVAVRYSTQTIKNPTNYFLRYLYPNRSYLEFFKLDQDFKIQSRTKPYIGDKELKLEDPRITRLNNMIYVIMVSFNPNSSVKIFPNIYEFDNSMNYVRKIEIDKSSFIAFNYPNKQITEKNWCPFPYNGKLYIHTDTYPVWRVRSVNLSNGKLTTEVEINSKDIFKNIEGHIRCSTSFIDYTKDTYLCGLHIRKDKFRIPNFTTVFAEISKKSLLPIRITEPLCLCHDHNRIQFVSGLEIVGDDILIGLGIGDYEIKILKVKRLVMNNLLL